MPKTVISKFSSDALSYANLMALLSIWDACEMRFVFGFLLRGTYIFSVRLCAIGSAVVFR